MNQEWKRDVQPICDADWQRNFPGIPPMRVQKLGADPGLYRCCLCGKLTADGIRFPVDPSTVPFPTEW